MRGFSPNRTRQKRIACKICSYSPSNGQFTNTFRSKLESLNSSSIPSVDMGLSHRSLVREFGHPGHEYTVPFSDSELFLVQLQSLDVACQNSALCDRHRPSAHPISHLGERHADLCEAFALPQIAMIQSLDHTPPGGQNLPDETRKFSCSSAPASATAHLPSAVSRAALLLQTSRAGYSIPGRPPAGRKCSLPHGAGIGNHAGRHSIRVNAKRRICFRWTAGFDTTRERDAGRVGPRRNR